MLLKVAKNLVDKNKEPEALLMVNEAIEIEPSEPYLSQIIHYIGSDNIIFGSDYPHMDHKPDIIEKAIALEKSLSTEITQKLLWDNPARFYSARVEAK